MLGWFIILVPTVIIVIYIILAIILGYNRKRYHRADNLNKVLTFLYKNESRFFTATSFSIICIIIMALTMLCSHMESRGFIAKYEGVAAEYQIRSNTFSMPERVAAFNYAIDLTAEAAVFQYWNKYFDPFIPDKINQLKPIR